MTFMSPLGRPPMPLQVKPYEGATVVLENLEDVEACSNHKVESIM